MIMPPIPASNMPGETFISRGFKYVLRYGPKGNLRPYYLGPLSKLSRLGWVGLAIGAVALAGAAIWYVCKNDE